MKKTDRTLFIMMPGDASKVRNCGQFDFPRWFSYPVEQLESKIIFSRKIIDFLRCGGRKAFLVFNVSIIELLVALLWGWRYPIYAVYQWIPMENLSWHKRFSYWFLLSRCRVIVVYNIIAEEYIKKRFPCKQVIFLKLWVDTDWFSPELVSPNIKNRDNYVLCPGSHRRNEAMVVELSKRLGIKIIRFSQDSGAIEYYRDNDRGNVDFMYDISFEKMRELYAGALFILNMVDDTEIPAGITCLIEALSMDNIAITPSGHSGLGYCNENGAYPFLMIDAADDIDAWERICREVLDQELKPTVSPRQYAIAYCSPQAAKQTWQMILAN